jgi:uncharacterized membrane protein SpoIIM required for sporulation
LLASFIVVPVAFLLQGETVLIFWGNEDVLWYAIVGVTLLSGLIVRLGLAHFRREYLLGREIDSFNIKNIWRTFQTRFSGGAISLQDWYRTKLPETVRQLRDPMILVCVIAVASVVVSYLWVVANVPAYIDLTPDRVDRIKTLVAGNLADLDIATQALPAPLLFFHNARATLVILLLGLISFGTIGITVFIVNMGLVGGVLGAASLIGLSPWLLFVTGVLPHGIFELTAVFLATAAMFKAGAQLVTPQPDKSLGEVLIVSLADWSRIFIGLVIPLLAVAAIIEIYLTPVLIRLAFPFL